MLSMYHVLDILIIIGENNEYMELQWHIGWVGALMFMMQVVKELNKNDNNEPYCIKAIHYSYL